MTYDKARLAALAGVTPEVLTESAKKGTSSAYERGYDDGNKTTSKNKNPYDSDDKKHSEYEAGYKEGCSDWWEDENGRLAESIKADKVGWYVYNEKDKIVAGPFDTEVKAKTKAAKLGADTHTTSYVSDYFARRMNEATGCNKVYDDYATWRAAAEKVGLAVYAKGASDGNYDAKKDGEVYGRFVKDNDGKSSGWIHSSAGVKESAPAPVRESLKSMMDAKRAIK